MNVQHRRTSGIAGLFGALVSALMVACNESTGPGRDPGVHVLSSVRGSDTVLAWVAAPLVVEVRDSAGRPRPGVTVRFAATADSKPIVATSDTAAPPRVPFLDTTDSQGRASAYVRLGTEAGPARLAVEVRSLAYADTLDFTVLPGRALTLRVTPGDTAAYENGTFTVRGQTFDRFANPRDDPVQFSAGTPGVTVQGSTVRITGPIGRERVLGTSGVIGGAAWISVVPRGVLATRNLKLTEPDNHYAFAIFDLDGSSYRPVLRKGQPENLGGNYREVGLHWAPSGDHLVFSDGYPTQHLHRVSPDGVVQRLFSAPTDLSDLWPQYTRDGAWMLFARYNRGAYRMYVHRARSDGSGEARLSQGPVDYYELDLWPSPSPDGTRVVYATDRESSLGTGYTLWVQEVATGAITRLNVKGEAPRWSPVSDWIAFVDDYKVKLIRADGSGLRTLSSLEQRYLPGLDWSPDGRWIVASRFYTGPVDLIEVETGLTLPLAFTDGLIEPTWKPR